MIDGYIAVTDSGIGGISTLDALKKVMPRERFLYFGDNDNAPYGNRTKDDLLKIIVNNFNYLHGFGIKAVVCACNTLSVAVLDKLRYYADVPVFGVFPPVFYAAQRYKNALVLSTPATAKELNASGLPDNVFCLGISRLAKEIENHAFDLSSLNVGALIDAAFNETVNANLNKNHDGDFNDAFNKTITAKSGLRVCDKSGASTVDGGRTCGYDALIIGCTHYSFVKNKISDHFCQKKILNGNDFTASYVKNELKHSKSLGFSCQNDVLFVGRNAAFNRFFYEKVVMTRQDF